MTNELVIPGVDYFGCTVSIMKIMVQFYAGLQCIMTNNN